MNLWILRMSLRQAQKRAIAGSILRKWRCENGFDQGDAESWLALSQNRKQLCMQSTSNGICCFKKIIIFKSYYQEWTLEM